MTEEEKMEPAMIDDMIHVCFSIYDPTGEYGRWTAVAMVSMLENTKRRICVHLLHEASYGREMKKKFRDVVRQYAQEIQFHKIHIPEDIVRTGPPDRSTPAHYFRLKVAEVLPSSIKKVIYFDSDLVIQLDIGTLWDMDLGQNLIMGRRERRHANPLLSNHILDARTYINSGVILMDLDSIRQKHQLFEEATEFFGKYPWPTRHFVEQDAVNYVFRNEIGFFEKKFNFFTTDLRGSSMAMLEQEIIYHYGADNILNPAQFIGDFLYLQYLEKTPWRSWIQKFYIELVRELQGWKNGCLVSEKDVVDCYRCILGRMPESKEVVLERAKTVQGFDDLRESFLMSEEFSEILQEMIARNSTEKEKVETV